ncbi:MerR family transcriptional regulator [Lactobacillus paracollinoides] [Lactiplantibacillus mudanjiangensis]|nr:MerR family transcriptional regulator [Lactobacillus paracollinoides] [Lactiplantibacillus mudanjiangensis]
MMTYSIGEVAQRLGVSVNTLRYYDQQGLMPDIKRSTGGKRLFEEDDLHYLYVVLCLKRTGMTISQIQEYVALTRGGDATLAKRLTIFKDQMAAVDKEILKLQTYRDCLNYKAAYYQRAVAAGTESVNANDESLPFPKIMNMEDD